MMPHGRSIGRPRGLSCLGRRSRLGALACCVRRSALPAPLPDRWVNERLDRVRPVRPLCATANPFVPGHALVPFRGESEYLQALQRWRSDSLQSVALRWHCAGKSKAWSRSHRLCLRRRWPPSPHRPPPRMRGSPSPSPQCAERWRRPRRHRQAGGGASCHPAPRAALFRAGGRQCAGAGGGGGCLRARHRPIGRRVRRVADCRPYRGRGRHAAMRAVAPQSACSTCAAMAACATRPPTPLRSFDDYPPRNDASRLVGRKLIFYTPSCLQPWDPRRWQNRPGLRRWQGATTPAECRRILPATRIDRSDDDYMPGEPLALHTATQIDLDEFGDGHAAARPEHYRRVPSPAGADVQNRFVGDWLMHLRQRGLHFTPLGNCRHGQSRRAAMPAKAVAWTGTAMPGPCSCASMCSRCWGTNWWKAASRPMPKQTSASARRGAWTLCPGWLLVAAPGRLTELHTGSTRRQGVACNEAFNEG